MRRLCLDCIQFQQHFNPTTTCASRSSSTGNMMCTMSSMPSKTRLRLSLFTERGWLASHVISEVWEVVVTNQELHSLTYLRQPLLHLHQLLRQRLCPGNVCLETLPRLSAPCAIYTTTRYAITEKSNNSNFFPNCPQLLIDSNLFEFPLKSTQKWLFTSMYKKSETKQLIFGHVSCFWSSAGQQEGRG